MIRNWARRSEAGATTAVAANEDVVPARQLREAYAPIRELERLVDKKQMEIEILEAAREVVKKVPGCAKGRARTGRPMMVVCPTLGMSRRTGYYVVRDRPTGRYQRADDAAVL